MAQTGIHITASKRWFFWPALVLFMALGKLGILRDSQKAAKWLVKWAMRIEAA
jgi:hypothetical protein